MGDFLQTHLVTLANVYCKAMCLAARNDVKTRCDQGDQIGRSFAYWAIVYFGQNF
jgi:hypothetical protein